MSALCEVADLFRLEMDFSKFETQASTMGYMGPADDSGKQSTMTFQDMTPSFKYEVPSNPDQSFGAADINDADLGKFLERPLLIASLDWDVGTQLFNVFDPWALFFSNPRVINRIANFMNMRCKLHLKVVINGTPFHYGKLLIDYLPIPGVDQFTDNRNGVFADCVAASQRPHIYVEPTNAQGGEMVLPFFWIHNALEIPSEGWTSMGRITVRSLTQLKHANAGTTQVQVSVFAWCEDVHLTIPTSSEPNGIVPQAGDEYGEGIISKPASIISKAAGVLSEIPLISPYMRATQKFTGIMAKVATAFGYSRPAVICDISPVRPTYAGNMANCDAPDSIVKLTVDSKNEVTIDPRVTGLGDTDEMSIVGIGCRESILDSFPWSSTQQKQTLIWNSYVTPNIYTTNGAPVEIHMTPSAHVSAPFKFWRGSMKFRFQVVASNYHKGRLRIVWDPYLQATSEFNVNYQYIIDITDKRDFTIEIGWGNPRPFLEVGQLLEVRPFSTLPLAGIRTTSANGILSVFVLNELTTPNSSIENDVSVIVSTAMCKDFELAVPTNVCDNYTFAPQGIFSLSRLAIEADDGEVDKDPWVVGENVEPILPSDYKDEKPPIEPDIEPQVGAEVVTSDSPNSPMTLGVDATLGPYEEEYSNSLADVCFGESIVSIRALLKRYCHHKLFGDNRGVNNWSNRKFFYAANDFPSYRGYLPFSVTNTSTNIPYTYCNMTFLNWFTPAYVGYRGSIRHKFINHDNIAHNNMGINGTISVRRLTNPFAIATGIFTDARYLDYPFTTSQIAWAGGCLTNSGTGLQATKNLGMGVLEVEFPQYMNTRFKYAKEIDKITNRPNNNFHLYTYNQSRQSQPMGTWIEDYIAAGDDFQLYFYTGAPVVYIELASSIPVPSNTL